MTSIVDIANRALSGVGTRSTITALTEDSNEARAVTLLFDAARDQLLRMAPWNCATNYDILSLLKSAPGTPENPSQQLTQWDKTIPPPPWAYEYAYPEDCIRPLWIVPQFATGVSGVPITTAVTGGYPSYWNGPAVRFKVTIDQDASDNDIRVILTNQQSAILCYLKRVTDPNVWDDLFQQAFVDLLAAQLNISLTGSKDLANLRIALANNSIQLARAADGNEGLTINDVTPDWIRARGIVYDRGQWSPNNQFDWGPLLGTY